MLDLSPISPQVFFLHQLINKGKGEALRIRAILRSLVPTEDLVGIISIPLKMPIANKGTCQQYAVQRQPPQACVGEQRSLKSKHNGYRFQFSAHNFLISNMPYCALPRLPMSQILFVTSCLAVLIDWRERSEAHVGTQALSARPVVKTASGLRLCHRHTLIHIPLKNTHESPNVKRLAIMYCGLFSWCLAVSHLRALLSVRRLTFPVPFSFRRLGDRARHVGMFLSRPQGPHGAIFGQGLWHRGPKLSASPTRSGLPP